MSHEDVFEEGPQNALFKIKRENGAVVDVPCGIFLAPIHADGFSRTPEMLCEVCTMKIERAKHEDVVPLVWTTFGILCDGQIEFPDLEDRAESCAHRVGEVVAARAKRVNQLN